MSDQTPAAMAGWYPDPNGGESLRYWDGQGWTDHEFATTVPISYPGRVPEAVPSEGQRTRRDRTVLIAVVASIAAVFIVIGAAMLLASPGIVAWLTPGAGAGSASNVVPNFPINPTQPNGPEFDPTLLRNDVTTPSEVTSFISVENIGDQPGTWSCTVVLRNTNGDELGQRDFVAKASLAVGQSVRDYGAISVKAGTAEQVDDATSDVTCD
jgi:hypothetical protein